MFAERAVDKSSVFFRLLFQQPGALFEGYAAGAVSAVIGGVAAGLVREQVDGDIMVDGVLKEIDDIAVEGDRIDLAAVHLIFSHFEGLFGSLGDLSHPALFVARFYPRPVHLGGDRDTAGDVRRLRLRAAHAAEPRGDVETSPQAVAALAELDASRVEDGVIGAVDDALRPDVHPAARGHLPVVGDAELHRAVPLLLVVKDADHQAVGEHHARRGGGGFKEAERVSRL